MWVERELKDSVKNLFVQIVRESCQKCVAPKDTHTPPTNSFWFEPPRLSLQATKCYNLMNEHNIIQTRKWIDGFRCIKIQPNKTDLNTKLWGIITEFVGFIPQSLVLRPIVLWLNFNISKLVYFVYRSGTFLRSWVVNLKVSVWQKQWNIKKIVENGGGRLVYLLFQNSLNYLHFTNCCVLIRSSL